MNVNQEIEDHWSKNGDKLQFKELENESYDMIRGPLVRYAYGRLKDWMDAEDAVHNAYVHIMSYPPQGEGHNFGGLYKLCLDRAIAQIRSKNDLRSSVLEEENIKDHEVNQIDNAASEGMFPDQVFDLVDQIDLIMDMSDNLKPKQKAIVRLAFVFGYSYKEISAITKSDAKQIDNVLTQFRNKIRENPNYEDLRK